MKGVIIMIKRTIVIRIFLLLAIVGLLMLATSPVMAARIKVNSTEDLIADDGSCTLREAIIAANADTASGSMNGECQAGNGADTIVLQGLVYFLTITGTGENSAAKGDLDILDDLIIKGKGTDETFINGGKIDRVFHVRGNVVVNFKGVTIQNGLSDSGAGIYNDGGTLIITDSMVSNNMASGVASTYGAGIYNNGTLTIINSAVSNNVATENYAIGGGIHNTSGSTLTISNSAVSGNTASGGEYAYGGGIYNLDNVTITISKSTVSNNIAAGNFANGGGIFNGSSSTLKMTITKSSVSNNTVLGNYYAYGGGIGNGGALTITKSIISNNMASGGDYNASGGGILNYPAGTITMTKSTVSGNMTLGGSADASGGGIGNGGTLTVEDQSKISGNFASDYGGGLYNSGTYDISPNSKVFKNIPDDIYD
jgi:CSLREA domain-containing protein